jgi:hypothetical protein
VITVWCVLTARRSTSLVRLLRPSHSCCVSTALRRRRRRYAVLAWWSKTAWAQGWLRLRAGGRAAQDGGDDGGSAGVREPRRPSPVAPNMQGQRIAVGPDEGYCNDLSFWAEQA